MDSIVLHVVVVTAGITPSNDEVAVGPSLCVANLPVWLVREPSRRSSTLLRRERSLQRGQTARWLRRTIAILVRMRIRFGARVR